LQGLTRGAAWFGGPSQAELRGKYYRLLIEEAVARLGEDSEPLAKALEEIVEMEQELADWPAECSRLG
jgi:hypothetical protein